MQRITDPTASATVVAPPALTGTTGYFGPGVPGVSIATRFRYWYATMIQEELMSILAAAGVAADTTGTVFNQVVTSIQALIGAVPHGVQTFFSPGSFTFTVPAGVTVVEAEIWAGGSGSWASVSGIAGGGGSGGGYARKRIAGLTPDATITVVVGAGGTAGTTVPVAPGAGGASSFGTWISATGGSVNSLGTTSVPNLGNIAGGGSGGDLNLSGGDGGQGQSNQGGLVFNLGGYGGDGPLSGGILNSGTFGNAGRGPGGGGSGAGTGAAGTTAYNGAAGAAGACVVRW